MKRVFITATGTDIGKTFATAKLIELFSKKGLRPGVYKPVETGVKKIPLDANYLLSVCSKYNKHYSRLKTEDITAYHFELPAAPYCADNKDSIDTGRILTKQKELEQICDILLIEGAGGLMVPIKKSYYMIDLLRDSEAFALLVTPSSLGCINSTLLSMEALEKRDIYFDWCVNIRENLTDFEKTTKPFYDAKFPNWWSLENGLEKFVERYCDNDDSARFRKM